MNMRHPLARKEKLVVRELDGEVLVYDSARNKAFCLNQLAGAVWKLSDGQKSAAQIAREISKQLNATIDEKLVWSAIDRLGRDNLLEYCVPMPTRRQQLKAWSKAAAIAGPLVASMALPASAQQGRSCIPSGMPCTPGATPCCNKNKPCTVPKKGSATCS
jgi:hypothetical protein